MQSTFLVQVDVGDDTDLASVALDVQDAVESAGIPVLSVHPWARPTDPTLSGQVPGTAAGQALPAN